MDIVVLQIAIAFLPGIVWARIDRKYASMREASEVDFLVKSLAFGLASYAIVFALYKVFGFEFSLAMSGDAGSEAISLVNFYDEILISIPVAIAMSIIWVYSSSYKWFGKMLQKIGATKRFGDEDVWAFTFNSSDAFSEYVHVRDVENNLTIAGWVSAFSDHDGLRELLLRNVITYDDAGAEVSRAPHFYIAREPKHILIEFPAQDGEE